jgi:hypothetical protein
MAYIKHHPHGNVYYFIDTPDKKCYVAFVINVSIGDNYETLILMEAVYEEYYYKGAYSKTD